LASTEIDSEQMGDWRYLVEQLWLRTVQPISNASFVIYVLIAIVGLGCLGIWVELIKFCLLQTTTKGDGVITALATFYPPLIGAASIQLALSSTARRDKVFVSIAFLSFFMAILSVVLISILYASYPRFCFGAGIVMSIFSVWLWWFSNGDDPTYKSVRIDAPSGGDTERELIGDMSGFQE
jgi:hypothetical protein